MPIELKVNKLPEKYQGLFVADGCKGLPADASRRVRSPWHDAEEAKRGRRDFLCNIWRTPIGSSDTVFDPEILNTIKTSFIKPPDYKGDIGFDRFPDGHIDFETVRFWINLGSKRLNWWGKLIGGRPNQGHNFVIGCDISWGLGSSNSVASIYDVNTNELCGEWVCANTKPEDFADIAVAIAYWVGGVNKPILIWEANGGQGTEFCNRVLWNRYYNVHIQTRENEKTRKRTKKYGWHSSTQAKSSLLEALSIALSQGITDYSSYKKLIVYSEEFLDELFDYIFPQKGKEAVPSKKADEGSGARERHGDRVIAAGLCVLGAKDQVVGKVENIKNPPPNSFASRYKEQLEKIEKNKIKVKGSKRYLF